MAFQGDSIYWVEVEKVVPNPFQPRVEFHQGKLQELADSIRMYGVLQPLTVTRSEVQREDGTFYTKYELIAGERRLRASKLAGVAQVPVIIREGEENEQEKLELAIIENLQREDLNAVDRALAFKQLADTFGLSHVQVAKKMGRSREYVSNSIRLLGLPDHMLNSLKHAEMMEGHARTLLMLTDRPEEQEVVYKEILLKKLSVREVERIVRKIATDKVRKKNSGEFDESLISLEKRFTETLGTRVQIQKTDFGGKLTIDYFSEDDLETILKKMKEEAVVSAGQDISPAQKISDGTALNVSEPTKTFSVPVPSVNKSTPVSHSNIPTPPNHAHSRVENNSTPKEIVSDEGSLSSYVSRPTVPATSPVAPESYVKEEIKTPNEEPSRQEVSDIPAPNNLVQQESAQSQAETKPVVPEPEFHHPIRDLFGRAREAQVYEPVDQVETESIDQELVPAMPPAPDTKTPEPEEDDGDLYSMRNFGV